MKIFTSALFALLLVLSIGACKNQNNAKSTDATATTNVAAVPNPDTLVGFPGMNKAAFKMVDSVTGEFTYQHFTIRVSPPQDNMHGEYIMVVPDNGTPAWAVPTPQNAFFHGVVGDRLILDVGTGPDERRLQVIDLQKQLVIFTTKYCGESQVLSGEKLWYYDPVLADTLTKKPECPQQADWQKNGLRVGYGQKCIFDLKKRMLTRKSEFTCVPLQ